MFTAGCTDHSIIGDSWKSLDDAHVSSLLPVTALAKEESGPSATSELNAVCWHIIGKLAVLPFQQKPCTVTEEQFYNDKDNHSGEAEVHDRL